MSEISTRIRKYLNNPEVNDPEVTKHYGRWCAFTRDQRRQIRELCNTCDMFEKTADSFWIEIERLKAEIERLTAESQMADGYADALEERAKAEAVKEFAERLEGLLVEASSIGYGLDDKRDAVALAEWVADRLTKEFTEGVNNNDKG